MQFSLPFVKLNDSCISGNLHTPSIQQRIVEEQELPETPTTPIVEEYYTNEFNQSNESPSSMYMPATSTESSRTLTQNLPNLVSPDSQVASSSSSWLNPPRPRPKKTARQPDLESRILDYLTIKKTQNAEDLESNPRKMFLLSLLPEVEAMTEVQMRRFKRRVLDVVEEILTDTPSDSRLTVFYESVADALTNPSNTNN